MSYDYSSYLNLFQIKKTLCSHTFYLFSCVYLFFFLLSFFFGKYQTVEFGKQTTFDTSLIDSLPLILTDNSNSIYKETLNQLWAAAQETFSSQVANHPRNIKELYFIILM